MRMSKRIVVIFLSLCLVLPLMCYENVDATSSIKSKLDSIIQQYPSGTTWTSSFDRGIQCYGFAKLVIYKLFGTNSSGGYRSWTYAGVSTSGMNNLGSITSYTSANVKQLLSKAQCGDVLQFDSSSQHSMIVYSVDSDGVWIYDCNWVGSCVVSLRKCSFGSWNGRNSAKLSLLRSNNAPSITGTERKSTIKMFASHYGSDYLTAMNNSVTSGYAQDTIYFWYVISDDYTGDLYNSYTDYTYTVNLTLYYSDGTYKNFTYNSSDNNWLRLTPQRSGLYKMELQLSGEVDSDVLSTSYTVSYNAGLSASRSSVSLNLNGTNTSTITFTPTGGYPGSRGVKYDWDSSIIEKVSGSWSNGVYSLSIKGLKCGSTTIVMQLYENYTDSKTVVASVSIPVTVTANTTTLSVNTSYNASISSAGVPRYYKYVPSTSGKYVIYSTSGADPKVYLLNSNYVEITSDDDDGEGSDFRLEYNLTAGTTYYYQVQYYSSSAIGTIPFTFGRVYTITYNANGGSGAPSSQSKDYAANITLSSTEPTRQGYTFLGWSTSSSASSASYQPGRTFSTNANTTLYAVWRRDVYTLSLNSSYSPSISAGEVRYYTFTPSSTGTYVIYSNSDYDTKVSLLNASDVEITSDDDGGEGTDFRLAYTLTAGTKYYFAVKFYSSSQSGSLPFTFGRVYTITYNANGGSGAPSSQSKDYAANITLSSTEPTRQGYTFLGWSTSSSASSASYQPGRTFSTNANTTLYAVWRKSALLGDVNGDGLINPFDASLILRLDAMLISADSINLVAADVSGDGKVNALDASLILRYDAMLISTFPAER